ncbi:DNA-binding protein (fragment) [Cupriavidus oxalaticus]|jgi:nucleoid DNA-binding protein|uniref:DNA-binding protein n=2 Tax=Cupriavidus oxalaticus TaxID=96344 RepID=A0A375GNT9_9BURK
MQNDEPASIVQLTYIDMATKAKPTAKTATKPAAKKAAATKAPVKAAAKKAAPAKKAASAAAPVARPLKDTFNKSSLVAHLVAQTELEAKTVKTVLAHLENTIVSALNKKGAGEFTLPGLLKVTAQQVPAKKKRFGKDPFTGEERWFPAKPASVKVKVRPLKKLKDAAA